MKEQLFNKIAERLMRKWDAEEFKKTHPRLLTVILESMEKYDSVKNNDNLSDVRQQSELLNEYENFKLIKQDLLQSRNEFIDEFLKERNCG